MPTALIILENPWWDTDANPGQASVVPFFTGLERVDDSFKLFHSLFYDANSFELALDHCAANKAYDRYVLYIAAHGGGKLANIQIGNFTRILNNTASKTNIVGVLIGACNIGKYADNFNAAMHGSNIKWMAGYTGDIDWITSTLVDISIINKMISLDGRGLNSRDAIANRFTEGLRCFNPSYQLACNAKGQEISLQNSIRLVIQPTGQGNTAKPYDIPLW